MQRIQIDLTYKASVKVAIQATIVSRYTYMYATCTVAIACTRSREISIITIDISRVCSD